MKEFLSTVNVWLAYHLLIPDCMLVGRLTGSVCRKTGLHKHELAPKELEHVVYLLPAILQPPECI